jgi:uncharacterized RDD family membrane protein YckC
MISLPLAGVGSRMAAYGLDLVVRLVLSVLVVIPTIFAARNFPGLGGYFAAGALVACFILHFCYYVYFETLRGGQTPGKRRLGIRVVKLNGAPVDFLGSVLRNVMRIVDWLPAGYGLGVATIFLAAKEQRLGDITAGTVVVRDRRREELIEAQGLTPEHYEHVCRELGVGEPARIQVNLTDEEAEFVAAYLSRLPTLNPDREQALGERVAAGVHAKTVDPDGVLSLHLSDPARREAALRLALQRHLLAEQR